VHSEGPFQATQAPALRNISVPFWMIISDDEFTSANHFV
jgi:hypothetical protein